MRRSEPDAVVHLGTGPSGESIARAIRDLDWDVPRIMNDAFFIAKSPHVVELFEGWVGTAAYDDENEWFTSSLTRYEKWAGQPVTHEEAFACTYTMATATLEGIRMAPVVSREGVKRGLESVTLFPSAIGGPRTCVGWGPYSRRGVRGADVCHAPHQGRQQRPRSALRSDGGLKPPRKGDHGRWEPTSWSSAWVRRAQRSPLASPKTRA